MVFIVTPLVQLRIMKRFRNKEERNMIVSKVTSLEFSDSKQKLIEDIGLTSSYEDYNIDNYYRDNELAKSVIRSKYIAPEDNENLLEFWARIALGTAQAEYIDIIRKQKQISILVMIKATNSKYHPQR